MAKNPPISMLFEFSTISTDTNNKTAILSIYSFRSFYRAREASGKNNFENFIKPKTVLRQNTEQRLCKVEKIQVSS